MTTWSQSFAWAALSAFACLTLPSCELFPDCQLCLEGFPIIRDTNGDGILSPGEHATLRGLDFRNTGTSEIRGLQGAVSSTSPYIEFDPGDDSVVAVGATCYPGSTCSDSLYLGFTVSPDTPLNSTVEFRVELVDDLNNFYSLSFAVRILDDDVELALEAFTIIRDTNGDGILSPGEHATLRGLDFRNTGTSEIRGLQGAVSSTSPYIEFDPGDDSVVAVGATCYPGSTCSDSLYLGFTVSPDTPLNSTVEFSVELIDQLENRYELAHGVLIERPAS